MTLDEFFAALEKTPRDWQFRGDGEQIRCFGELGLECPITSIENGKYSPGSWRDAARSIGLRLDSARKIVNAADSPRGSLRKRLLQTCGLEEAK